MKRLTLIILPAFLTFYSFNTKKDINKAIANVSIVTSAPKIKIDSFPVWIKNLYEIDKDEFLNDAIPEIIYFKQISDSISYCFYEVNDGTCQRTFVATQKKQKHYKKLEVGDQCDGDFSQPSYSYTDYKHDPVTRNIKMTTYVEKAKSKYLVKEGNFWRFKDGYNFENVETIHYSMIKKIKISTGGNIIVQE